MLHPPISSLHTILAGSLHTDVCDLQPSSRFLVTSEAEQSVGGLIGSFADTH